MSAPAVKLPPEQESPLEQERIIPMEIIEEILLYLPVKSLRRFSTVSKSWNTMIFDDKFFTRHQLRIPLTPTIKHLLSKSDRLISPYEDQTFVKLASCLDMDCIEMTSSLFLRNSVSGKLKKLPPPLFEPLGCSFADGFSFGMGSESLDASDMILIKIPKWNSFCLANEIYSERSNSWRMIQPFPAKHDPRSTCVFLDNAFHWIADSPSGATILSIDLSTGKYAEVAPPQFDPRAVAELGVLKISKLCLHLNYHTTKRFVSWEMQEFGDEKSWTKLCDIDVWRVLAPRTRWLGKITLTPIVFYTNGLILIKATTPLEYRTAMFMYKDEQSEVMIVFR